MAQSAKPIELPDDLRAFAEERVRTGQAATVDDVVRGAVEEKKLAALRDELDKGAAELDAGDYVEGRAEELIAGMREGLSFDEMRKRTQAP